MSDPRSPARNVQRGQYTGGGGLGTCPVCDSEVNAKHLPDHIAGHAITEDTDA